MPSEKQREHLITWAANENILIHADLDLTQVGAHGSMGIARKTIPSETTILSIPLHACITPRLACRYFDVPFEQVCRLDLESAILAAYLIRQQGDPDSRWRSYLTPLPKTFSTPLYWSQDDLLWLAGTNLEGETDRRRTRMEEAARALAELNSSIMDDIPGESWLWAMSIIDSRSFPSALVDATCESHPILLPVLDTLNHAVSTPITWQSSPETLSFVTGREIPLGAEVYNNYGAKSNEEFLMSYGFCLADVIHDVLMLKLPGSKTRHMLHGENLLPDSLYRECREFVMSQEPEINTDFQRHHHTLVALSGALALKYAQHDRTNPAGPAMNTNQSNAFIYRHGQMRVLQSALLHVERAIDDGLTQPDVVSLGHCLTGELARAVEACFGVTSVKDAMEAGLQEVILSLYIWTCGESYPVSSGDTEWTEDTWQQIEPCRAQVPEVFGRLDQASFCNAMLAVSEYSVERASKLYLQRRNNE